MAQGGVGIGTTSPDIFGTATMLTTTGDISVQGGDIYFGTTDKIRLTRGGGTYFQTLTSGGSAAGVQQLGAFLSSAYAQAPQRGVLTMQETGSKPAHIADYGYVWVSGSTPNELYFMDLSLIHI